MHELLLLLVPFHRPVLCPHNDDDDNVSIHVVVVAAAGTSSPSPCCSLHQMNL